MLVDPLTGVPAGLLTIVTVNWLSTPEKYHSLIYIYIVSIHSTEDYKTVELVMSSESK